jgi:hypothetical protein
MLPVKSMKINRLKWLLPACLLGAIATLAFYPADDWQDKITEALEQYAKRFPQEKVYLQLDKDYYAGGETMWFKAYVLLQGNPSLAATNLYVELIDQSGNVVKKELLSIGGATGSGAFELPENQKPGQYQIRAYTAWMLNFDSEFLYYKNITIFDAQKSALQQVVKPVNKDFSVQFFPEGGSLVNNVPGRVAFKAIDELGYPIEVNGIVQNMKGETVALIKTAHDGMGVFDLTPISNDTYKALVQTAKGQKTILLPAVKADGVGLKVVNKGGRIFYSTIPAAKDNPLYDNMLIVGQMQQRVVYKARLNASDGQTSGFLPTKDLPTGIVQFTVFSSEGLPMAERLSFVKSKDQLPLRIQNQNLQAQPRRKNTLEIKVPDTMLTSLSVSITDADLVPQDPDQNNILSNLLLTSDLKGYIANPAQYFKNDDPETLAGLDLIMMTNGWRRFSWEKILHNYMPEITYHYEQGLLLKGVATINKGTAPMANGKVDFILKQPVDTSTAFSSTMTNEKGEFAVDRLQFVDTIDVFYRANDPNRAWKDVKVKFEPHFFDKNNPVTLPYPFRLPTIDNAMLASFLSSVNENNAVAKSIQHKSVFLKEVNIRDKRLNNSQTTATRYTTGMFYSGDGTGFDLTKEEQGSAMTIFQYLQSRVSGLRMNMVDGVQTLDWRTGPPALYLNEMPTNVSMLENINITDVAFIKVLRPTFPGGFGGANGAIAVYLKKGGDAKSEIDTRGFDHYTKAGYSIVKEFYAPDYTVRKEIHILQDKRLTLYWNPNLIADTLAHVARVSFYNNDFTRHFRVVVEGMGEDGTLGHLEQTY